jgi:hypothetical protein
MCGGFRAARPGAASRWPQTRLAAVAVVAGGLICADRSASKWRVFASGGSMVASAFGFSQSFVLALTAVWRGL